MKTTITRIVIILTSFILLSGLMVTVVNASGVNIPGNGRTEFRPGGGDNNGFPPRPEGGENREREGGSSISRLILGLIKNTVVIALLVAVIVIPKNISKKRKKNSAMSRAAANGESQIGK